MVFALPGWGTRRERIVNWSCELSSVSGGHGGRGRAGGRSILRISVLGGGRVEDGTAVREREV